MAVTAEVISTSVGKLFNPEVFTGTALLEVLGGNPYVATGIAVTAASLQTLIATYLGHSPEKVEVTSLDKVTGVGFSPDGVYHAVWDGTAVEIWIGSTGAEAGAIDLSAATTKVRAVCEFTIKY